MDANVQEEMIVSQHVVQFDEGVASHPFAKYTDFFVCVFDIGRALCSVVLY